MSKGRLATVFATVALLVGGGFVAWQTLFGSDAPEAVTLERALDSLATASATATTATSAATDPTPGSGAQASPSVTAASTASATPASSTLAHTWSVDPAASFVGYRVVEQLVGVGAATAVGRTSNVTGMLIYDGAAITEVTVAAQLNTLKSDESRRDNALRTQALETSRFPTATFELSAPIAVGAATEGQRLATTASGNLTLHGVTRAIDLALEGQFTGGRVVVVGSTEVAFADYGIAPPRAPAVLSVEDHGIVELQLVFVPA